MKSSGFQAFDLLIFGLLGVIAVWIGIRIHWLIQVDWRAIVSAMTFADWALAMVAVSLVGVIPLLLRKKSM